MKKLKGILGGIGSKKPTDGGASGGASFAGPGYDIKEKDLTKIHKAAWTGDIAKVKQLAKKDPSALDKENRTPLHLACVQGHASVVQVLLEWKAKANVGDNQARTPLMKAVECNQSACVKLLLEYHAEVDTRDGLNNTALHLAVKMGCTNIAAMLINEGAQLDMKNRDGQTPLHLSILDPSKREDITRLLLENNANPDVVDNSFWSSLHHACNEDALNHVKLLLAKNANTAMKDTKGCTAEDRAMMKGHHGCSQLIYDHNLNLRKIQTLGGSIPSTPRGLNSLPPSSHTTPRDNYSLKDNTDSDFGMPMQQVPEDDDSDDQTVSKQSGFGERQDSWADDTDVSSAMDDHRKKFDDGSDFGDEIDKEEGGQVKVSLTKNVVLDSDDDGEGEEDTGEPGRSRQGSANASRPPIRFRKVLVSTGSISGSVRPMYSRTPTPDNLRASPGKSPSPAMASKIPVKNTLSGQSHTSVEDAYSDDEDDSSPLQRNRVSFKEDHQIRELTTDDETDIEDDEEEVVPAKTRRIETPEEASLSPDYTPTGISGLSNNKMSAEEISALLKDLGLSEDEADNAGSDVDFDTSSATDAMSQRVCSKGGNSQPNTPRGILKTSKADSGKPPSVDHQIDTDPYWDSEDSETYLPPKESQIVVEAEINLQPDKSVVKGDESDWDSTKGSNPTTPRQGSSASTTPRQGPLEEVVVAVLSGEDSGEYDSDLENSLHPEGSHKDKEDRTANDADDLSEHQESNTLEIIQESTTPEVISTQDKLANTGEINALVINELNESTDFSFQRSRSSSVAMETPMAVIEEEKTEMSESEMKTDSFQKTKLNVKIKTEGVVRGDAAYERDEYAFDSEDDTIDKIEISRQGSLSNHGNFGDTLDQDDIDGMLSGNFINDLLETQNHTLTGTQTLTGTLSTVIDLGERHTQATPLIDGYQEEDEDSEDERESEDNDGDDNNDIDDIDNMIEEEISYYDSVEKAVSEALSGQGEASIKDEIERSLSEGKERPRSVEVERSHSEGRERAISALSGVLDRKNAPQCVFEYEPSTTEAESGMSDSDTLDTKSLQEEFVNLVRSKKNRKHSPKTVQGKKVTLSRASSINSDKEVARALTRQSPSTYGSEDRHLPATADDFNRHSVEPTTQDTMDDPVSFGEDQASIVDEEEEEETSQWDSTDEGYTPRTPRTPRDAGLFGNQGASPEVQDIDYEESEEIDDQIEVAVTSFHAKPTEQTAEPKSDLSQPRSGDTVDAPTSSGSLAQQTVITAVVEEPGNQEIEDEDEDRVEVDSEWDSEDDVQSDVDEAPVYGQDTPRTPRTPREQTTSIETEEESISEWEIEKQQKREKEEEENRINEEKRRQAELEEEMRQRRIEEEQKRQEEIRRLEELEEEEERQRQEERRKLEEMEEEEERQRQWEEEERSRQEKIQREVQEELERERLRSAEDISDESSFSADDGGLPDDNRQESDVSQHASQRSKMSQHSQASDNDQSDLSSVTSPRARELKKPPPKLVVSQFFHSPTSSYDAHLNPVKMGEIENESPAPDMHNLIERNHQSHSFAHSTKGSEVRNNIQVESDDEIEDFEEDEAIGEFQEEQIQAVQAERVEAVNGDIRQSTFARSNGIEIHDDDEEDEIQEVSLDNPPPLPSEAPPKQAMSLPSEGNSAEEEEDMDYVISNKPQRPSFTFPDLSANTGLYSPGLDVPFDDDGLSVTSTENGDISTSYRPENLPYGKDMLVSMNLNDSNAVLKLQEHLREHRRQLEHERGQKMLLENRFKLITKEKAQLQKGVDSLKYQKSVLEQNKLDIEAKIRNLEYTVNEEEEKRKNAEMLLKKTKDHLDKKEEQFTQEMEAKQHAELMMRNIQMELRTAQNQIKDLEEEKVELDRLLSNEKNARLLQEKINEEQQRLQQHMHEESMKSTSQKDDDSEEAKSALDLADDDIKHAKDMVEKYKNETSALKAELQKQRVRLTEENNMLTSENEKLQQRVEDLRNEVKLNEEALTQLTVQQNLHQSKLVTEATMLGNTLDKERVAREKIEAELESVKTRLHTSTMQLEKSQQARNDFERRLHGDREEWARQLERKDQELSSLQEKLQTLMHSLNSTETKLNAVENELHISNTTLLERTNQFQQTQRDLQYYKTAQENYDSNYRHEKDQNSKLQGKIESLQDRLSSLQHENLSLKQQVETAQQMASDRSGFDLQDKLNTMIGGLKSDHDKARASLEDKNSGLQDTISRLREEVRNSENRRSNLEQDIRRMNQEITDLVRKLSVAEASLDVASKAREHLEQERLSLKMDIEKFQQKYQQSQENTIAAQTRMSELVERLDKTEQSRLLSNQQLVDTSATMHAFNSSKSELEENYQKMQVDNVRLDAELKHEKQKSEMLQRDLADSQKVRSSLEALCSNLKSTNAHLEEKLEPGQLKEVTTSGELVKGGILVKETEEHKGLWEQEVISRSKLGLRYGRELNYSVKHLFRENPLALPIYLIHLLNTALSVQIAQLDRHKQETTTQLEEEKRKTRKAIEQKRLAESKLEAEQDKCQNLQKEVASLKAYLKVAKKRLKEPGSDEAVDTNESRFSTLHSTFDKERQAMEEMLVSVKAQLEHMKLQHQDEVDEKERVHQKNLQLENELKTIKKLERSVQKIDRSKKKLEQEFLAYKNNVEVGYTDKVSLEEAKKELEARYRLELNRKLDEVNNYLEDQARTRQRLDTSRDEQDSKHRSDKKRLEEDVTDLRIRYEQATAKLETKELEAKRFRDLYESEMQWRMRLSEQLYRSTDKAFGFKNNAERQRNRMFGSMTNVSMNGPMLDLSKINGSITEDALSNKLRAELDRSIAKHLEAAPHDQIRPLRSDDPVLASSNFAKANADYIEVLKRKYCV